ncbi:MAG: phosphotransferase [Pseudomonadota bacterium]
MDRFSQLQSWAQNVLSCAQLDIQPASSDASFRRYFRLTHGDRSYIVMDAPPSHEDVRPFLQVMDLFRPSGMHVPELYAQDIDNGFLLLGDFGSTHYLAALNRETVERLYGDAMDALLRLQTRCAGAGVLPPYDEALLRREMALFTDWFLGRHYGVSLSARDSAIIERAYTRLVENALAQPRVCVHRDYHSRNLMVVAGNNPGVLDFQDAVFGPVTYDLASLLRDCYIRWPDQDIYRWVEAYYREAKDTGIVPRDVAFETFKRWFDLMGMQRHLKAIGIFARLNHRDHKPGYLQDIPRTLGYVLSVAGDYPEFADFADLVSALVVQDHAEGTPVLMSPRGIA